VILKAWLSAKARVSDGEKRTCLQHMCVRRLGWWSDSEHVPGEMVVERGRVALGDGGRSGRDFIPFPLFVFPLSNCQPLFCLDRYVVDSDWRCESRHMLQTNRYTLGSLDCT
jgi:hypothetical protein